MYNVESNDVLYYIILSENGSCERKTIMLIEFLLSVYETPKKNK
jgi:hypothetical protein